MSTFLSSLRTQRSDWLKLLLLVVSCGLCALMLVETDPTPTEALKVGDIAPRTVKAPFRFTVHDFEEYEDQREAARGGVLPVYSHRVGLAEELAERVRNAFAVGRTLLDSPREDQDLQRDEIVRQFRAQLGVQLPQDDIEQLIETGFPEEAETAAVELITAAMNEPIVQDAKSLPEVSESRSIRVIEADGTREERVVTDLEALKTPADSRQGISLMVLESGEQGPAIDAAARIARALVRPNLTFELLETEERRSAAMADVPLQSESIRRGAILFRAGDKLSERDLVKYRTLQEFKGTHSAGYELLAIALFLGLLFGTLYHFGSSYLQGFSSRLRDATAVALLLVVVVAMARLTGVAADTLGEMVAYGEVATTIWFLVPVAGAAMLVRLLVGVNWAMVFVVAASALCGLSMELQALPMVFFLISGFAGAGSVEGTRERLAVLRAGLFVGLMNAAAVLLIHFLQLFVVEAAITLETKMRPLWSMGFAFGGGLLSAFLVLGLMPVFEAAGFVTDYRMMELANLNHPLLRQLMLRAPGSYHHSVLVGTLAEAACEAIGANALQAKVSAYFHDIGKSLKPQYFVENQRDGVNKHNSLDPHTSARVIINHVIDGGRMAREYGLPKPIIDNIYMHHGDGLLLYFYSKAQESDPDVDESDFRYPGPKPNTREAGVIMLADKVEAATRTIKTPTEENIRAMINKIISSVIEDGQFDRCPLTFREIRTMAETFVSVLVGIYHQRIEYPQTRDVSQGQPEEKPEAVPNDVITLDIPGRKRASGNITGDYEAVEHLPRGQS